MIGIAFAAFLAVALVALQTGYVAAFSTPFPLLSLPLIAIVSELSAFRFARAFTISAVSGLVIDLLVAPSFGAETGILLLLTLVLATLFTRVFTNSSLPALLALNTVGFLALHLAYLLRDVMAYTLSGDDIGLLVGWDRLLPLAGGIGLQLVTVIVAAILITTARKALSSVIVLR